LIRVTILDSHPATVFGLREAFERTRDLLVTAACTGAQLPPNAQAQVALLGIDGIDSIKVVADAARMTTKVIVMSSGVPRSLIQACLSVGAIGHLDKRLPLARFCEAVRTAARIEAPTRPSTEPRSAGLRPAGLSRREYEVLAHIAEGCTHEQTARRMGVSRNTVDTYVKRIRAKVGVGNKADLTRLALHQMLSTPAETDPGSAI